MVNNKILSICIPSYNMEAYLSRNIDSLISANVNSELEIIIVNDGSKDKTIEIANDYQRQYPDTVKVIDKPNGHYGSCVNAALQVATGKYFRIIDADDWVNSESLSKLVLIMRDRDEDAIFTKHTLQYLYKSSIQEQNCDGIIWDQTLTLNEYVIPEACCAMHSMTFKTQLFKKINYKQTEGICYTDTQYVYYLLISSKTLYCVNVSLYQYYIGREDQTMSKKSLKNNFSHFFKLINDMIEFENNHNDYNSNYISLHNRYFSLLFFYLFLIGEVYNKANKDIENDLYKMFYKIVGQNSELKEQILGRKIHGIQLIKHWSQNGFLFRLEKIILNIIRSIKG